MESVAAAASTFVSEGGDLTQMEDVQERQKVFWSLVRKSENETQIGALLESGDASWVNAVDPLCKTLHRTPLIYAVCAGNAKLVKTLLKCGASINMSDKHGFSPLHYAVAPPERHFSTVGTKTGRRTSVSSNLMEGSTWRKGYETFDDSAWPMDETPLIVSLLLRDGADVKAVDNAKSDIIHTAAVGGDADVISLIVAAGADPNECDSLNRSPLHLCAWAGHAKGCYELIERGAAVDTRNKVFRTPLHVACLYGHTAVAVVLIEAGASLNSTASGDTPLHFALKAKFDETAEMLVNAGSEWDVCNAENLTALTMAVQDFPALAEKMLDQRRVAVKSTVEGNRVDVSYDFRGVDDVVARDNDKGDGLSKIPSEDSSPEVSIPHHLKIAATAVVAAQTLSKRKMGDECSPLSEMIRLKRIQLISHPVVMKLLEVKWNSFARKAFLIDLYITLFNNVIWIIITSLWHSSGCYDPGNYRTGHGPAQAVLECVIALLWITFLPQLVQHANLHRNMSKRRKTTKKADALPIELKLDLVSAGMFSFIFVPFHVANIISLELNELRLPNLLFSEVMASIVVTILFAIRLLTLLSGYQRTGQFVIVIEKMLSDVFEWFTVAVVLLLMFGQLLYLSSFTLDVGVVVNSTEIPKNHVFREAYGYQNILDGLFSAFRMMLGAHDYDSLFKPSQTVVNEALSEGVAESDAQNFPLPYQMLVYPIFVGVCVIMTVLMLNLLIAMMNDSYVQVKAVAAGEWRLKWARRIKIIEGRVLVSAGKGGNLSEYTKVMNTPLQLAKVPERFETKHYVRGEESVQDVYDIVTKLVRVTDTLTEQALGIGRTEAKVDKAVRALNKMSMSMAARMR